MEKNEQTTKQPKEKKVKIAKQPKEKKVKVAKQPKEKKAKLTPYNTMIRIAIILLILILVGIAIFWGCAKVVEMTYENEKKALETRNEEGKIQFDANLAALRSQNAVVDPETGDVVERDPQVWEGTLEQTPWSIVDDSDLGLENTSTVDLDRNTLLTGGLMVVNAWHPLPSDYPTSELASIGTMSSYKIQVQDGTVELLPEAYNALEKIISDAKEAGHEYYIVREAFRSTETQTKYFQNKMEALSNRYSGDILIEQTKKEVNYPGTSDYQTGLSFRLDLYKEGDSSISNKYQETEQGKWFTENAWKYGLILRFPTKDFPNPQWEDKSYKTGVSIKLNLYRYVGTAHSTIMRLMDYCLEEYVEFLIEHPHITVYEDGQLRYEIVRIAANEYDSNFSVPVPNPASSYQASFDNMGGIVMAYTYN